MDLEKKIKSIFFVMNSLKQFSCETMLKISTLMTINTENAVAVFFDGNRMFHAKLLAQPVSVY